MQMDFLVQSSSHQTQMGSLSVNNSETNISHLGTFNIVCNLESNFFHNSSFVYITFNMFALQTNSTS
jgi:hypothetical protein